VTVLNEVLIKNPRVRLYHHTKFRTASGLDIKCIEIKRIKVTCKMSGPLFSQWAFFKLIKVDIKSLLRHTRTHTPSKFTDVRPIN